MYTVESPPTSIGHVFATTISYSHLKYNLGILSVVTSYHSEAFR